MPNRLAETQSLYLRKHAHNPIDWWSWSPEALARAQQENKPIFLSIGYSSCHWCTVMEGEAFSDPAIADYLNANFLPIKVDREERPDIDSIYMQALQMMTGQGGWPLNIFLTSDRLIPFYGGTYFPVAPRFGRPGFLQVLQSVRRFHDLETEKLSQFTAEILTFLQDSSQLSTQDWQAQVSELLSHGLATTRQILTPSPRDLGRPRFPMMPYAIWLLQGDRQVSPMTQQRGEDLALGGIYDHIGGGFHRYTVDATWTVPHFEKMLYDNGQILEFLANLCSSGDPRPEFSQAIAGTVQWLEREMTAAEGYFYAAQDADNFTSQDAVEPEEGDFYVWDFAELQTLFNPDELALLQDTFTLTPGGNFEGKNVLQRRQGGALTESVKALCARLFALRYGTEAVSLTTFPPARDNQEAKTRAWPGRIPPVTDTKLIVAWNSLMISGLARAYAVLGDRHYRDLAHRAMDFILTQQWLDGRLQRLNYDGQPCTPAQSEDYAFLIKALLDLHCASPEEPQWLGHALKVQSEFDQFFWSEEQGGYYNTAIDRRSDLLITERSYQDNATPSANGIAIQNLVRLALLTDNLDLLGRADQALASFASVLEKAPASCPSLFSALDQRQYGFSVKAPATILATLRQGYYPLLNPVLCSDLPAQAIALVCQGMSCLDPSHSLDQLHDQISLLSAQPSGKQG